MGTWTRAGYSQGWGASAGVREGWPHKSPKEALEGVRGPQETGLPDFRVGTQGTWAPSHTLSSDRRAVSCPHEPPPSFQHGQGSGRQGEGAADVGASFPAQERGARSHQWFWGAESQEI